MLWSGGPEASEGKLKLLESVVAATSPILNAADSGENTDRMEKKCFVDCSEYTVVDSFPWSYSNRPPPASTAISDTMLVDDDISEAVRALCQPALDGEDIALMEQWVDVLEAVAELELQEKFLRR